VLDPAQVIDIRLSLDRHDCSIVSAAGFRIRGDAAR
jgi:hypothetical protein